MSAGEATREYYREQGRAEEQARIIKLVESLDCNEGPNCDDEVCFYYQTPTRIIALIKGEANDRN